MTYEDRLRVQLTEEIPSELKALAHRVIGCAIEVHRELGPGYLENMYQLALETELESASLPYRRQVPLELTYKSRAVGEFRLDLVIADTIVVELKTVAALAPIHIAQVIAYLKASRLPLGLILNFNVPVMVDGVRRVSLRDSPDKSLCFVSPCLLLKSSETAQW